MIVRKIKEYFIKRYGIFWQIASACSYINPKTGESRQIPGVEWICIIQYFIIEDCPKLTKILDKIIAPLWGRYEQFMEKYYVKKLGLIPEYLYCDEEYGL